MAVESQPRRTFFRVATLALAGAILYWTRPVMVPLTIAVLVTFVLAPVVSRLERWHVPRVVACVVTLLGVAALLSGIGFGIFQQTGPMAENIPTYRRDIVKKIHGVREDIANSSVMGAFHFLQNLGGNPGDGPKQEEKEQSVAAKVEIPVVEMLRSAAGIAADVLFNAVIVLFLALLMLMRREDLRNRLIQILGTDHRVRATRAMDDASRRVSRFLFVQLAVNVGYGVAVAVVMHVIGVPYAFVLGAVGALLRYVPYVGGWIEAFLCLIAAMVLPSWTPVFITLGAFVAIEILQSYLVEPLAFGHSVGVSGPGQVVAMLFWATLWGPIGLILSTPMTACLCVIGRHFQGLRFAATMLGDEDVVDTSSAFYQRLLAGDTQEATLLAQGHCNEHSFAELVDDLFIPALLASRSDVASGDLSKEDEISIVEAVREIQAEVAASQAAETAEPGPPEEASRPEILVATFPFNDEIDDLMIEMLKATKAGGKAQWLTESTGEGALQQLARRLESEPRLIVIGTSVRKNLPRLRGAVKTVRKSFPAAEVLLCCWCLESESDVGAVPLKQTGVHTSVCTNFACAEKALNIAVTATISPPLAAAG